MKKLLSLPPNLVECFHDITGLPKDEWYCTNDPVDQKLGSGGGTTWVLDSCPDTFRDEKKIILHAGGQSRRLPSYAPSGKILTPIPVFRWERGQKLSQDLLSLQLPLYEDIMAKAPASLKTMIVSGDVFIRAVKPLQEIPEADVVCYGLWLNDDIAKDHGVFVSDRNTPNVLKYMLQKPSIQTLHDVQKDHYTLVDIGIWILSDRAVDVLKAKSRKDDAKDGEFNIREYDLYSEFGCALGANPSEPDDEVGKLSVAILPLPGGEFYHYGTTPELLSSTLAVQNIVVDQREIMHRDRKPHPSMFVQNADIRVKLHENNTNVWIENSVVGAKWTLTNCNVITCVPENDGVISLE
ncbi:MAG: bifunctional fucokinase/L-fucose-1-P-guanylyltransferase, partial [Prevotella sp.]|nr:bifunctional fucokinase/L-fucose-1-P-guanylyltransferase [Prevotella sp.]